MKSKSIPLSVCIYTPLLGKPIHSTYMHDHHLHLLVVRVNDES